MEKPMENNNESSSPHVIKHLVLAGGGIIGYKTFGILRESEKAGFWNIRNIQSIYGTSIGGMMAVMIALKFDWDVLDDFIIKRPWHHVFKFDMNNIFLSFHTKGILDIHVIEQFYEPLFKAKDLDIKITMKELYEFNGIEIHLFSTEFNETIPVDISWKTHPDWTVIESVYCSCCLPFLFSPYFKDEKIYYDGGVFCNYPLLQCCKNLEEKGDGGLINTNEILGIKTMIQQDPPFNEKSTLFDYITHLMKKFIHSSNEKIKKKRNTHSK